MHDRLTTLVADFVDALRSLLREQLIERIEAERRGPRKATPRGRPRGAVDAVKRRNPRPSLATADEMTFSEATDLLGLTDQTLRKWVKSRGIPVRVVREGRKNRHLIPRAAVEAKLAEQRSRES